MLQVWGNAALNGVQKVTWCCDEIALPFARHDVDIQNKPPEILALNPNGQFPIIDDDGFVLWEANACIRYLAAKYGNGKLWPQDLNAQASASRWMDWQLTSIFPPVIKLFRALIWKDGFPPAEVEEARNRAIDLWQILDSQLAHTAFVAGDELTVGDIAFGNTVHRWFMFSIERPEMPNLEAWYRRLCARSGFKKHVIDASIDAPNWRRPKKAA